ncbi:MAG: MFS transporter, partial [Candidatus Eremiobacteraeota bacterium]|nr:MFS transporter [Candidatus Eremiobacteraeota bacterium]
MTKWRPTIVVYGAGMLQGFAFTLVPALATVFAAAPYNINARGFGILFIPLTVGAIIGAALTPKLAAKTDTVMVLRIGVVANAAALVALLIAS